MTEWKPPSDAISEAWRGIDRPEPESLPPEIRDAAKNPVNLFGKYIKVEYLARGGAGDVWKCYDRELGRWVAAKFLRSYGETVIRRFLQEAKIAAHLEHPNIARIYEKGTHQGQPFIVLQFVPGRSLAEKRPPLRDALAIMAKVARAIHFAHEQGVIHRDLKPGNIMLTDQGEVFVLDFGLAKEFETGVSLSLTGAVIGTPGYMPPEQARGEIDRVNARSDVYSLGATLYEVATGNPPFPGVEVVEVLRKVQHEDPPMLRRVNPEVSWELETIVMKAIEKDPARRYSSARELAEDLERCLHGEPILACRPSLRYRIRKGIVKYRWIVAALLTILLSLVAVLGYSRWATDNAYSAVRKATVFAQANPKDLEGQSRQWQAALHEAERTGYEPEAKRQLEKVEARIKEAAAQELAAFELQIKAAVAREELKGALNLLDGALPRRSSPEWAASINRLQREINETAANLFEGLKVKAVAARDRRAKAEVDAAKAKVARWGLQKYVTELDAALVPSWRPIFDGKTTRFMSGECAASWQVVEGALSRIPAAPDQAGQSREDFGDGEIRFRVSFEAVTHCFMAVRQGRGACQMELNRKALQALGSGVHEVVFTCQGEEVTATLNGNPVKLEIIKNVTPSGRLQFDSTDGVFRIHAIDVRDLSLR